MILTETLKHAESHLAQQDDVMARLIAKHGPCTLGQKSRDPFHVLCSSIIGQQLSTKAADAIQRRVVELVSPTNRKSVVFVPIHFLKARQTELRNAGLSGSKARWLTMLAQAVYDHDLNFSLIQKMSDKDARAKLESFPGIGRWTAEMFLIFALDRIDIFSMGDAGLRRSINRLYNDGHPMDADATEVIVRRWAPYRSVASWYLWRLIDGDSWIWD